MKLEIQVDRELFQFSQFSTWVNKAQSWFRNCGVRSAYVICVDSKGRICRTGKDFHRARDEGAFPVVAYALEKETSR